MVSDFCLQVLTSKGLKNGFSINLLPLRSMHKQAKKSQNQEDCTKCGISINITILNHFGERALDSWGPNNCLTVWSHLI